MSVAFAQSGKLPHENPENATGLFDKVSLLLHYGRVFLLGSLGQYDDARAALDEFGKIDIPEEFRHIIERYNELSQELFTTLDYLETILDETADMIARNEINEAKKNLDIAEIQVENARFLLDDLIVATDVLFERFGVFTSPEGSDIREAHARLIASMEQLQQLLDSLDSFRVSLSEQYTEIRELLPTQLTLDVYPTTVFIGESIEISGVLSSYDDPLAGKTISVILDDVVVSEIVTIEDGTYDGNIVIPYQYIESMTIVALYEPQGNDAQEYQASWSPQIEIDTQFYTTQLDITAPGVVYPGIPFSLGGEIITNGVDILRTVSIIMNDTQLTEIKASGQFNVDITLPEQITTGAQKISVIIEPLERYAGVSLALNIIVSLMLTQSNIQTSETVILPKPVELSDDVLYEDEPIANSGISQTLNITVSLIPIQVDIKTPSFIILPKSVELSGNVLCEDGPIANACITLTLNNKSATVLTAADGSFTATLDMPLDISFIGQRDLMINIDPLEPWASSLLVTRRIMVINPAGSLLVLLAALALVVFLSRRRWRNVKKGAPGGVVIRPPVLRTPRTVTVKLTGIKARIISAYRAILAITEKISGIRMLPHMTLREFLMSVTKLIPKITRPLSDLTAMVERVLYSNQKSTKQSAVSAERLTVNIKEELNRGAS